MNEQAALADLEPRGAMAHRRREHHKLVHDLLDQGAGIRQIARHLGWSHNTVSRYTRAAVWQEMVVGKDPRPSSLDPSKPYLLRRIAGGRLKAASLHREIATQGFTGNTASSAPSSSSTAPAPTSVRWLSRHRSVR